MVVTTARQHNLRVSSLHGADRRDQVTCYGELLVLKGLGITAQLRELLSIAVDVAFVRRRNALRKKGRAFTPRAAKIWRRAGAVQEGLWAVAEAFAVLGAHDLTVEKRIELSLPFLKWLLSKEQNPRPGRRPRPRPLLEVARSSRPEKQSMVGTGRPRLLAEQPERVWLARFYGLKARLWMEQDGYMLPIDTAAAAKKARAVVKASGGLRFLDGDCGVSDRLVLRQMLPDYPSVSLTALRSRLHRARQRHRLALFE